MNIQKLGYGKPLKLVTTYVKPSRHDTSPASLCPSRRCQDHTASIDKFAYGHIEDEGEKKQAGRLNLFQLSLLTVIPPAAAPKDCATESCNGREVINAQPQLLLSPENSCIHPLVSKRLE